MSHICVCVVCMCVGGGGGGINVHAQAAVSIQQNWFEAEYILNSTHSHMVITSLSVLQTLVGFKCRIIRPVFSNKSLCVY